MRASESPVIRKATTILLAITLLVAVVIIDGVVARYYYYSNSIRLQNAADEAISAGIVFLPANPALAFKTARQYALLNGVRRRIHDLHRTQTRHSILLEWCRAQSVQRTGDCYRRRACTAAASQRPARI